MSDAAPDLRNKIAAVMDGLTATASALREVAEQIYDGRSVADARALVAEIQALKAVLAPSERVLDIAAVTAAQFDLTLAAIKGGGKTADIVMARHITMHIAHSRGISLAQIARSLGMDHTSVAHGIRRIERQLSRRGGQPS